MVSEMTVGRTQLNPKEMSVEMKELANKMSGWLEAYNYDPEEESYKFEVGATPETKAIVLPFARFVEANLIVPGREAIARSKTIFLNTAARLRANKASRSGEGASKKA